MAGAYQRNVTNPNAGKRSVKNAFAQRQGGKSGPCISYKDGKRFLFEPATPTAKKNVKKVVVVKEAPPTKRSQFSRGAQYGESWQSK